MDALEKDYAFVPLLASGTAVGLSEGLMGNSEVGHLNIGAGRIVWQDIVRIDMSIKKRQFHKNPALIASCQRAKETTGRLHAIGLVRNCNLIFSERFDLFLVGIRRWSALAYPSSLCTAGDRKGAGGS